MKTNIKDLVVTSFRNYNANIHQHLSNEGFEALKNLLANYLHVRLIGQQWFLNQLHHNRTFVYQNLNPILEIMLNVLKDTWMTFLGSLNNSLFR